MAGGKITNRTEYERALAWYEKKHIELNDPLLTDEQREKLRQNLETVRAEVNKYELGANARREPDIVVHCLRQNVEMYVVDEAGNVLGATTADSFRRGELVKVYPGLREVYRKLGWPFDDPDAPAQETIEELPLQNGWRAETPEGRVDATPSQVYGANPKADAFLAELSRGQELQSEPDAEQKQASVSALAGWLDDD
jgi:hypothetical protein